MLVQSIFIPCPSTAVSLGPFFGGETVFLVNQFLTVDTCCALANRHCLFAPKAFFQTTGAVSILSISDSHIPKLIDYNKKAANFRKKPK